MKLSGNLNKDIELKMLILVTMADIDLFSQKNLKLLSFLDSILTLLCEPQNKALSRK